jgi:hypothetical protein
MELWEDQSDEAQGLRLVRAFLALPPDKRAEVIAFVERLAGAQEQPGQAEKASPA